jgi:hypothetical protein
MPEPRSDQDFSSTFRADRPEGHRVNRAAKPRLEHDVFIRKHILSF